MLKIFTKSNTCNISDLHNSLLTILKQTITSTSAHNKWLLLPRDQALILSNQIRLIQRSRINLGKLYWLQFCVPRQFPKFCDIWEGRTCPPTWASYQIRKTAGCACWERFSPLRRLLRKLLVSDPGMHHSTCVMHVQWCMSGSLTCGDGDPGIPSACAPAILRIWPEAHDTIFRNCRQKEGLSLILNPRIMLIWWNKNRSCELMLSPCWLRTCN